MTKRMIQTRSCGCILEAFVENDALKTQWNGMCSAHKYAYSMIDELWFASTKSGPFNTAHEGYAIILEEIDELWDEIKKKSPDKARMRKEAIQIGAMCLRFLEDVVEAEVAKEEEGGFVTR